MSARKVAALLTGLNDRLPANRKVREGTPPPDRQAQVAYINEPVQAFQACQPPIISGATTQKAFVGDLKNSGRAWQPTGPPAQGRGGDCPGTDRGQAGSAWASDG